MSEQGYSDEDRRAHLIMVQGVVTRLAGASASAKGWLLPVVTAAYGYALSQNDVYVALLGLVAVVTFAILDAHYLRQERAFRVLSKKVATGVVTHFDMDVSRYLNKPNGDADDERSLNCTWPKVIWSWSLAGFYGPFAAVGFLVSSLVLVLQC